MNTVAKPVNTYSKSHSNPSHTVMLVPQMTNFFMGKGEDSVSSQEIFPSKPIAIQQKEISQALEF